MPAPLVADRYAIYGEIAAGGMASVHYGRLLGPVGFSRTVAIKRLHPQYAKDPEFVAMFLDEARVAARIRHPNVVPVHDVVATNGELFLVMDYVQGETLARLLRTARAMKARVPIPVACAIAVDVLQGLHAAHEATSAEGAPLGIVHRDVSPQNVLVGQDGVARVVDFGVAKAAGRAQTTREGQLKGKVPYMAPEQLRGATITRRSDVWAASVVLWEAIALRRLFRGESDAEVFGKVLDAPIPRVSTQAEGVPEALDAVIARGLERNADARFESAREMAQALEAAVRPATASEVAAWVDACAGEVLLERARRVHEIESDVSSGAPTAARPSTNGEKEPASQVSSISVATPARPSRSRRRRNVVWIASVAAAIAAAFALGRLGRDPIAKVPAAAPSPSIVPPPIAASTEVASPIAASTHAASIDGAASVPASATEIATTNAPSARKNVGAKPPPPKPPAAKPSAAPKASATKPASCYSLGADGILHVKPECL